MTPKQEEWNKRIHAAGRNASKFTAGTIERIAKEGGDFWIYQQSPHNTDAYREGWERTFGNKGFASQNEKKEK